jgi:uroporphyrin-III C-methyltransferase
MNVRINKGCENKQVGTRAIQGKVYLVGGGPGDPELLTLRAASLIATADCIFHDDLVPLLLLEGARTDAQIHNVGKRAGRKSITQDQINGLLIESALSGKSVVRLKIGDPMLFGRAAEELEALRAASIPCEVIPGITAAFAAAASLQAPLTDRRHASKVTFVTGHRAEEGEKPSERGLALGDATIALYMPGSDYERLANGLIASGYSPATPCMVISRCSLEDEQTASLLLSELAAHPPLPAPSILLVGTVLEVSPGYKKVTSTF